MSTTLRAGVAQIDITPPVGTQLTGSVGQLRPVCYVGDPLYARAIVFDNGARRWCLMALDLTIITEAYSRRIRTLAQEQCGLPPDAVMVHVTQTHSAPSLGDFGVDDDLPNIPADMRWARGGDEAYGNVAVPRIAQAIKEACDGLQPVTVGVASGVEGRVAFNRRAVGRDGMVYMPRRTWDSPVGNPNLCYMEGPIDPELGVLAVRTADARLLSLVVNYTCHPVHVFPKLIVSADWPGEVAARLQAQFGVQCVPVVVNGACGDVNPWPPFDPDYREDHRLMGGVVADTARRVTGTIEFGCDERLASGIKHVKLPLRLVDSEKLAAAEKLLREEPEPPFTDDTKTQIRWDWIMAAGLVSVDLQRRRETAINYEIQVLRIGDTAFVGLPGEPFASAGLQIKLASPARHTYIVHCTTQYVGYIPTREGYSRGGHEAATSYWAKLVPDAFDIVVAGAVELLGEVFDTKP